MLIVVMQTTERLIVTSLTYALPSSPFQSLDDLQNEIRSNKGATLGRLIAKLKQRVDLADDFEEVLRAFLQDRNTLVHDLGRVPGFNLSTREGRAIAGSFLANLVANHDTVMKVFVSLLSEWTDQIGFKHEHDERIREMLGDLDGVAGQVFFAKE